MYWQRRCVGATALAGAARLLVCSAHLSVRYQKGLDSVVLTRLDDSISDRHRVLGHLEPFVAGPGEALLEWLGQGQKSGGEVLARLGIEGHLAEVGRG